jgi:hypothetical protein
MADRSYVPIEWPTNIVRCSECKALLLDADVGGHETWHEDLEEALEDEDEDKNVQQSELTLFAWFELRASERELWTAIAPNLETARSMLAASDAPSQPKGWPVEVALHGDAEIQWGWAVRNNPY